MKPQCPEHQVSELGCSHLAPCAHLQENILSSLCRIITNDTALYEEFKVFDTERDLKPFREFF